MNRVYGLTGGIACGKSSLARMLQRRGMGWRIVDTDVIAHRLIEPKGENWQNVIDGFGPTILNADQTINRGVLGDLIFQEPSLREKLNSLTHPAIRKAWQTERESFLSPFNQGSQGPDSRLVIVIPLLFETGLENEFETVICVGCSDALQRSRLARRGLDSVRIEQRIASQWPLEEKMKRSRYLFWNEGTLEALARQAEWFCKWDQEVPLESH